MCTKSLIYGQITVLYQGEETLFLLDEFLYSRTFSSTLEYTIILLMTAIKTLCRNPFISKNENKNVVDQGTFIIHIALVMQYPVKTCSSLQTMLEIKRKILKDETHIGRNSFLLTVMCHGNDKGHLLDKDKKRAWILEDFIKELSLVETLMGKPKILVLQACRGGNKISTYILRY